MKNNIKRLMPYALFLLAVFYLLPLLGKNTGAAMLIMLCAMPALVFSAALLYSMRHGFEPWPIVMTLLLFAPSIFVFYNTSAWPYMIAYGAVAAAGSGVGNMLHNKK